MVPRFQNLFYIPTPVNQAKKNLLLGYQPNNKTEDGLMYIQAAAAVLQAHQVDIGVTADLVIQLLQSVDAIPSPPGTSLAAPAARRATT